MSGLPATDGNRSKLSVPLSFLTEIAHAGTLEELYASVARRMPDIFPADRISVALVDDDDFLRIAAMQGGEILYDMAPIPIRGSKLGDCYLSREPIVVNDADRPGEKYARSATPGQDKYRSTAILPLIVGDTCLGTLNFGCRAADAFSADTVEDLGQIATWIALQLSRFETYQRLKTSEARFDALIENAEAMIFAKASDGTMLIANRRFCEISGLRADDVVGKLDAELFGEEAATQWREDDLRILNSKSSEAIEEDLEYADGVVHTHMTHKFPVFDPGRGEYIICAISTDISERKQIEAALDESEQRARAFFDHSPSMMFMKDTNHRISFANKEFLEFYGTTEKEVLGKQSAAYVEPEVLAHFEKEDRKIVERGVVSQFEIRIPDPDGNMHDFLTTKFPVNDSNGNPVGLGGINVDVTELRNRERELEVARDEAELAALNFEQAAEKARAADRAKTDFLASMSHELRTPLNGILGMTHLLASDGLDPSQGSKVDTIRESGEALLTLLNDILDLSKVEAGELEVDPRPFRLADLVASIEALWGPQAEAKQLGWRCEIESGTAPVLVGDDAKLRQVVFNLVSNALKFTERGEIGVRVSQSDGPDGRALTRFEVSDTGPGIEAAQEARLFDKFTQADSTISRRYGGTGLGLAISKSLVELMGGEIGFDSTPGVGTCFWIALPLPEGSEGAVSENAAAGDDGDTGRYRALRILVAEDNDVNQKIIGLMLQRAGHAYDIVDNGAEAVEAIQRGRYDLVLMDIQMPEMDGISATRAIRELGGDAARTPIIALTANAMKGDREIYLDAGMNDYVAKPIKPDALEAALSGQTGYGAGIMDTTAPETAENYATQPDGDMDQELDSLFDGLGIDAD